LTHPWVARAAAPRRFKDPHRSFLNVTQQGGTPQYMAPELFNGSRWAV
jgi:hypothetical protein